MATDKSTIVSAQYSFGSTTKEGIHILQEPVPEVIELFVTVPSSQSVYLVYRGDEVLRVNDLYWKFNGVGTIAVGQLLVTHTNVLTGREQAISLSSELNLTTQGIHLKPGFIVRPNDTFSFVRSSAFSGTEGDNDIFMNCQRAIVESFPLTINN